MKVQEVKGRMVAKGIEGETLARKMQMDPSTFYRKLKAGGKNFTVENLQVMKQVLELDNEQAVDILILS